MARVRSELRDELESSGVEALIGSEHIYLEVDDAVAANEPTTAVSQANGETQHEA